MTVRLVAASVNDLAVFVQRRLLGEIVGVAVQRSDIIGDLLALGIIPGAFADPVERVVIGGR